MNNLIDWATRWQVPHTAIVQLRTMLGQLTEVEAMHVGMSEAGVQSRVRLQAAQLGWRLWRNNVGAMQDVDGRHIRFGLCNDSAKMNKEIKSADLIGIKPIVITTAHIGHTVGQFVSREVKRGDWKYGEDLERENAQERWAVLVNSLGGDAKFTTGNL